MGWTTYVTAMTAYQHLYIDGAWVAPHGSDRMDVIDSVTEQPMASIPLGDATDLDRAVAAAVAAFESWAQTPKD